MRAERKNKLLGQKCGRLWTYLGRGLVAIGTLLDEGRFPYRDCDPFSTSDIVLEVYGGLRGTEGRSSACRVAPYSRRLSSRSMNYSALANRIRMVACSA